MAARKRERLDAEALLAPPRALNELEVEVGERGTVLVRALTKAQRDRIYREARNAAGDLDEHSLDRLLVHTCLVEPALSLEQVDALFDAWEGADVDELLAAILRVSGMEAGYEREAAVRFRKDA